MPSRPPQVRVAVFTETFDEINGVANTYRRLFEYAVATDRKLDLYCFAKDEGIETVGHCRIHRFKHILPFPFYEKLALEMAPHLPIFHALWNVSCHVFHVAAPGTLGLHALAVARLRKQPIIGAYHTHLPEYMRYYFKKTPLLTIGPQYVRSFYDRCSLVLATTPKMHDRLTAGGMQPPVTVFSRGVDANLFHPRHRAASAPGTPPVILYVGRLAEEKNLLWLANILTDLRESSMQFSARFVGEGPLKSELQARLPWAEFPGYLYGEELARTYASADVFAFPSLTDTFGNVVLEAMASGLPVVVADENGPGEQVREGENGYIAPTQTAFCNHLSRLLSCAEERQRLGQVARQYAEQQTWSGAFDRLWEQYEELACRK